MASLGLSVARLASSVVSSANIMVWVIGVGEVILVEDTTGKGHLSQHVEGKIRHSIFVPVE
jgi:hypothetical protein